ncbi:hypothetical protein TrCOL_g5608 [Triparma columacea]|uniref:Uncharacterized protein n=1 Tax=Triparma columacea TaxID=722753 RepID=A0A9W7GBT7_9STRA|nr:hypothetical protein TrCOL_g5608 [Triparma columacea]
MSVLGGKSLADCDFVHGSAESLLVSTNLCLVLALGRINVLGIGEGEGEGEVEDLLGRSITAAFLISFLFTTLPPFLMSYPPDLHTAYLTSEVLTNQQLSLQTWFIHTSSLLEWLLAMRLIWDKSPQITWEGKPTKAHAPIVFAMIPLHASGVTACVYHLFSNDVPYLVAVQAGLTTIGNVCLWLATKQTRERLECVEVLSVNDENEDVKDVSVSSPTKAQDFISVVLGTLISGYAAKEISDGYSFKAFDSFGVNGCGAISLAIISSAAVLNYLKWSDREKRMMS